MGNKYIAALLRRWGRKKKGVLLPSSFQSGGGLFSFFFGCFKGAEQQKGLMMKQLFLLDLSIRSGSFLLPPSVGVRRW